jgi:hypothetical protein
MKFNDVELKATSDYDFWDKVMKYFQSILDLPPLTEKPYAMYIHALASNYEDPFVFSGMQYISKEMEKQFDEKMTYTNTRNYKSRIKKLGWLNKSGKFPTFLVKLRKDFKEEQEDIVRKGGVGKPSFSIIMKICY